MVTTHAQLSRGEHAVDNVIILPHAIVDELTVAFGTDDEQRRSLSLGYPAGHFDIDLGTVIECGERSPRRIITLDRVAESQS